MNSPEHPAEETTSASSAGEAQANEMEAHLAMIKKVLLYVGIFAVVLVSILFAIMGWKLWWHPYAKVVWEIPVGVSTKSARIYRSTADTLMVQIDKNIVSINPSAGSQNWSYKGTNDKWQSATVMNNGLLLTAGNQLLRLSKDGKEIWKFDVNEDRQLAYYDQDLALMFIGRYLPHNEWRQQWLAGLTQKEREHAEKKHINRDDTYYSPKWESQHLVAYDMNANNMLWKQSMRAGLTTSNPAVDSGLAVLQRTRVLEGQKLVRLLAFDVKTGAPKWKAKLPDTPVFGPVFSTDGIAYGDFNEVSVLNRDGALLRKVPRAQVELPKPKIMEQLPLDISEIEPEGFEYDSEFGKLTCTKGGNWSFALQGGILRYRVSDKHVILTGHKTREGGMTEMMGETSSLLGIEDELAGAVASSVAVADFVTLCLDRKTGKKLWAHDNLTGDIVYENGRLVVLQDTAKTSIVVRSSGAEGELAIHQIRPDDGKIFYSRSHKTFRLDAPRIHGETLVGIAFDRNREQPTCIGFYGLKLK